MLRTLLIATAMLATSGTALAHGNYGPGRVITVEPNVVISFGISHHDGFRVLYESGRARYWTHTPYYPGPTIVVPQHHQVTHVHHYYRDEGRSRDDRHGWHDGRRDHHRKHRHHGRD